MSRKVVEEWLLRGVLVGDLDLIKRGLRLSGSHIINAKGNIGPYYVRASMGAWLWAHSGVCRASPPRLSLRRKGSMKYSSI